MVFDYIINRAAVGKYMFLAAAIFIPTDPTDGYRHTRRTLLALFDVSAADPDVYVYEPLLP